MQQMTTLDGLQFATSNCLYNYSFILVIIFWCSYSRLSPQRGDKSMNYKEETIKLLYFVNDEKFLKYLYILVNEMIAKSCNN